MSSLLEALRFDILACILRRAALRDVAALGRCSRRLYEDTTGLLIQEARNYKHFSGEQGF